MRPAFVLATALAALMALPALSQPALSQPVQLLPVTYDCERGVILPVVYVNGPDADAHAIALIEGQLRVLAIAISASGARYREDDAGYQIWSKGETAILSYGPEEDDITLLSECRVAGDAPAQ